MRACLYGGRRRPGHANIGMWYVCRSIFSQAPRKTQHVLCFRNLARSVSTVARKLCTFLLEKPQNPLVAAFSPLVANTFASRPPSSPGAANCKDSRIKWRTPLPTKLRLRLRDGVTRRETSTSPRHSPPMSTSKVCAHYGDECEHLPCKLPL